MKVMKVAGGRVWHVVNETMTANRHTTGYVLCKQEKQRGQIRGDGVAGCQHCLELDNPFTLTRSYITTLSCLARGEPSSNGQAQQELFRRDYINLDGELTPRGWKIARDFTDRCVAVWHQETGLVHARYPVHPVAACNSTLMLLDADHMSTARYDDLRKRAQPVTCLKCVRSDI